MPFPQGHVWYSLKSCAANHQTHHYELFTVYIISHFIDTGVDNKQNIRVMLYIVSICLLSCYCPNRNGIYLLFEETSLQANSIDIVDIRLIFLLLDLCAVWITRGSTFHLKSIGIILNNELCQERVD